MEFYISLYGSLYTGFAVSIPNGMEFYLNEGDSVILIAAFQFPTGWNSTLGLIERGENDDCFNSQRDGILLWRAGREAKTRDVSIPNGMEFYPAGAGLPRAAKSVSIPNGMEFYFRAYREGRK